MQHHVYDLKHQKKGAVAVVTLDKRLNVRLMTMSDYRAFKAGRSSRGIGGNARTSPVRIPIPRDGHWVVVLDNGGAPYKARAGVGVEPPPPRMSLPGREERALRDIEVRTPEEPGDDRFGGQTWDVFLSHASEDKDSVAIPLRDALTAKGVRVWLDKTEMRIGDSLRRKIDQGIRASKFSIVVLSASFFSKGWTNHELDGLVTKTLAGEQTMLPIWHEVGPDEVRRYSASLADKVALNTASLSIEEMAEQIAEVVLGDQEDAA